MKMQRTSRVFQQETGFTLIETVLLLFVVSLILTIPMLSIDKMVERTQIDLFFRELTSNITLMQNHAILNGEATTIDFVQNDSGEYIDFRVNSKPDHPLNRRMVVDSSYYRFRSKEFHRFTFLKDTGNISTSDTFYFRTTTGDYKLTFWLGSGRFEIEKTTER